MDALRSKKGELSIVLILLTLVAFIFATGYYKIVKQQYAMDEIQSILDITGVSTLEKVIDDRMLKDELYGLDKNNKMDISGATNILNDYEDQIKKEYKAALRFNTDLIPSYKINAQDVYFENSDWGKQKSSPQIILETIMTVTMNIGQGHDYLTTNSNEVYSGKKNQTLEIISVGTTTDGKTELIIRSTVRSVYE